MMKIVYIETTIPSFYFEIRSEPEMVARKNWTREWWDEHRSAFITVTSEAVLDELNKGDFPNKQEALALMNSLSLVPVVEEIIEIVEVYIRHHVMPKAPAGDALHLALASYHKCDFLLTWNCEHLANANKFDNIRRVNTMLGLFSPALVTPLEFLGEEVKP